MESREQQGVLESMLLGSCMTPSLPPGSLCSRASVQTRGWLRTEVGWQLLAEVLITQLFIPLFRRGWCLTGINQSMQRFSHLARSPQGLATDLFLKLPCPSSSNFAPSRALTNQPAVDHSPGVCVDSFLCLTEDDRESIGGLLTTTFQGHPWEVIVYQQSSLGS